MAASFKVLIVGESFVGKTAIFQRLQSDKFNEDNAATIAATFAAVKIDIPDGGPSFGDPPGISEASSAKKTIKL